MLRPADCVTNGSGFLRTRSAGKRIGDVEEHVLGDSAVLLHEFRRVARKVLLQDLEHATRMLECGVRVELVGLSGFATALTVSTRRLHLAGSVRRASVVGRLAFIKPGFRIVFLFFWIPSREETVEIFGIAE